MSGLLKKCAAELSADELKSLRKDVGSKAAYPMTAPGYVENGKGERVVTRYLGILNNTLPVYSERDFEEVEGMALREMPTPSMLQLFWDAIVRRKPGEKRIIQFLKGKAGTGKTYMSEMIARMRSEEGPLTIDCGNVNLNELMFETVLDFGAGKRFYDALDEKIRIYNAAKGNSALQDAALKSTSIDILEDSLGEAFSHENGKIAIDWGMVKQAHKDSDKKEYLSSQESIEIAIRGLEKVAKYEGLENAGGNALGIKTQKGPAILAWEDGRELVLDEFNRGKEGSHSALHRWLQFLAGEVDECTVYNTLKEADGELSDSYTFRREDQKIGHFVTLTGNTEDDGSDVYEMPESLSSRIIPQTIPDAEIIDWEHRWTQLLTGLPLSTLYYAQQKTWDENPDLFREKLLEWRQQGETRPIPEMQMNLLRRWEDVQEATKRLSKFFDKVAKIVNPDSELHQAGSLSQLMDEISETFNKELSVDFRKIRFFIDEAGRDQPQVKPPVSDSGSTIIPLLDHSTLPDEMSDEEKYQNLGTMMTFSIVNWIIANTFDIGKDDLGNQLMQIASDYGITGSSFHEAKENKRRTLAQLLDDNPFESNVPEIQAAYIRDMVCDHLRDLYPEIQGDNDDMLTVQLVRKMLEDVDFGDDAELELTLEPKDDAAENEADDGDEMSSVVPPRKETQLIVFNENLDDIQRVPFKQAVSLDFASLSRQEIADMKIESADLISDKSLMLALASPRLQQANLKSLWSHSLSETKDLVATNIDKNLAMAEGRSKEGLAVTTVMVRNDIGDKAEGKETSLHLIWNQNTDKLLVVGEGALDKTMASALLAARVQYVDRNDSDALEQVKGKLSSLIGNTGDENISYLKRAFTMRNKLESSEQEESESFEALLTHRDVETFIPHYLMTGNEAPRLKQ